MAPGYSSAQRQAPPVPPADDCFDPRACRRRAIAFQALAASSASGGDRTIAFVGTRVRARPEIASSRWPAMTRVCAAPICAGAWSL